MSSALIHDPLLPIYPRLLRRVRAALIDSVVFIVFFFVWLFLVSAYEGAHAALKVGSLILIMFLLEPVLVSRTGGTVGHHLTGLRVEDSAGGAHVGILRATIRAVFRVALGAFSLIFILATRKHQAIHDSVSGTVVILKNPEKVANSEKFQERELVPESFELPSALRRVVVMLAYGILSLLILAILVGYLLSDSCIDFDACTGRDDIVSVVLGLSWFALLVPVVVFAWRGQLYGCRSRLAKKRS